jgi:hypothetical protein
MSMSDDPQVPPVDDGPDQNPPEQLQPALAPVPDPVEDVQQPIEPAKADDDPTPAEPQAPRGRLVIPDDPKGYYVVLCAQAPAKSSKDRPGYVEVACVKTHDDQSAKRIVMKDDGQVGEWLRHQATIGRGILLQAVPARNWNAHLEPTAFTRPEPKLTIH